MKAYIIKKGWGSRDCGGYDYLGVCLTEDAAYKFAEEHDAIIEEAPLLDVGILPEKERKSDG